MDIIYVKYTKKILLLCILLEVMNKKCEKNMK